MAEFTVTINDADSLAGITAARQRYNLDNPDNQIASDADYVQYVMESASADYARRYGD